MIKIESYKKGALLSIIFNGLAKGILFLLVLIIARYFGSNIKTDIYFFIVSTITLFAGFINAIDISVLIPESMRIREKQSTDDAMYFLNYFFRIYFFIGLAFVTAMYFFGTNLFSLVSKFSDADILLYKNYFLLGSCYFFFQVITNYINNILTSLKYFTMPMVISGINSFVIIISIVLLHSQFDVLSIIIGGLVAYFINLVLLIFFLKKTANWSFGKSKKPTNSRTWYNIIYTQLGQLATLASSYFPLYLLSGFNVGIISSMNYGKNIADVPTTLVTSQLSNVSGIKLNEQVAHNDTTGFNDTFIRTAKLMVFILVPVGFFLYVFAEPIVGVFYNTSTYTDTFADTKIFVQLLSISVFCIAVNSLVARLLIAKQAIQQGFIYQLIMNVLLLFAVWFFVKEYGAYGYGYAVITINIANYFLMYVVCKLWLKEVNYAAVLQYTGLIAIINAAIACALFLLLKHVKANDLIIVATGFIIWLAVLLLLNKLFGLNKDISDLFKRRKIYVN